jgi:hypothetical protein
MRTHPAIDTAHTALVAMDCQSGIVSIYAKPEDEFVQRASHVLRAARTADMLTAGEFTTALDAERAENPA